MPTNRYGQLISFATEVDEDTRFHRWMWITIARGTTVQRVAAERGHPDDARRIADENGIRSVRSKLYRPKLKVPGELRASASFDVLAGDQPPRIVEGYAKLSVLDRPERVGLTVFDGYDPIGMEVPIRFLAGRGGDGSKVERDIALLERMAGRGIFSGSGVGGPPVIRLSTTNPNGGIVGLIPETYQWSRQNPHAPMWRVAGIDWDAEPRRHANGNRIDQKATVTVMQATKVSLQQRSAAGRSKAKRGRR